MTSKNSRIFDEIKVIFNNEVDAAKTETDLFVSFRGFIILGRCLGILPFTGVFQNSYQHLKSSIISIAGVTNIACILLIGIYTVISFMHTFRVNKRNASEIALAVPDLEYSLWGLFVYTYFLIYREEFIDLFRLWAECSSKLTYCQPDKNLKRVIIIVCVVMFSSTVLENAVLHLEYFTRFDKISGQKTRYGRDVSHYQIYYRRAHTLWYEQMGYHPILPVLAFINHKLLLYGANYMDVLVALFARAMYYKFHALNRAAQKIIRHEGQFENLDVTQLDREAWNLLAKDHQALCDLMNAMNKFFSPAIFGSYFNSIYYMCLMLFRAVNPEIRNESILHEIYYPWAFSHIIVRVCLVTYCMAKINEEAHNTRTIVARCPQQCSSYEVAKLDRRVNSAQELGWTGLNCFTVTKPFMLSILNTVFVIEVVLLQGITFKY